VRVRANLAGFERRAIDVAHRRAAAVALTLLADDEGRPCFVLTRRAASLREHSGQWAIPGGRLDPGESQIDTALRELHEEVGLELAPPAVLGLLDDYATRSGYVITPVVVWAEGRVELTPDPSEVAHVYRIPVAELDHPDVPVLSRIPESDRPVLSIPLRGDFVHAPTAAVLYQLLEVAFRGRATRVAGYEQPVFAWR
jgi:8-oxo-dGTP pyrophosphatase MutT (NUDIX family)